MRQSFRRVSVRAGLPSRAWQSAESAPCVGDHPGTAANGHLQLAFIRLSRNRHWHDPAQVVEAAPESLRGPADASLLADFFSARLADWCGRVPGGFAASATLRCPSADRSNMRISIGRASSNERVAARVQCMQAVDERSPARLRRPHAPRLPGPGSLGRRRGDTGHASPAKETARLLYCLFVCLPYV